jgi:Carboxypeptidase regulatory-like domain/TonB dependent receptor
MSKRILNVLATCAMATICLCLSMPAFAQYRTSIQGVVTDTSGAVVPGATLSLKNLSTNQIMTTKSSDAGIFNFNALPVDHFSLTVEMAGFQTKVLNNPQLIPEQSNAINVQLEVGVATQTITVDAAQTPVLDSETANIGGTITSQQIQHMPSFNRDVFQLTQLTPGVISDGSQGAGGGTNNTPGNQGPGGSGSTQVPTENGVQANANGGQYQTNSISIDGISTVSAVWGGATIITPTEDSIANVRIVSNDYDAENGRFSGAQTMVTSKSGSNDIHGSLFIAIHRPGLNAYQRYNGPGSLHSGTPQSRGLVKDTQDFNQYGGSVGGPIWKDRLFAFFAYEALRNSSHNTTTGWYDTSAFDGLAPSGSIASTYLKFPGSGVSSSGLIAQTCANIGLTEGVSCRTIAGQGLNIGSPLSTPLGTQDLTYQSNNAPGVGSGLSNVADIADFSTVSPSTYNYTQWNGRLDAQVTQKDHASFAIYWVPASSTLYNGTARAYNFFHHQQTNDAFSVIWNHTLSPTFLNEARANAAGWRWNELGDNPQQPIGLPEANISTTVGSAQMNFFGAAVGSHLNQWTYTYKDIATKVAGPHTIKFGGEVTRLEYLNAPTGVPTYNFFNVWDFLNDAPKQEQGNFNSVTGVPGGIRQDDRENIWGFFVQDGWRILPNLTLNFGLRYSYFGSLSAKQNNLNSVQFGSGSSLFTGIGVQQGGNLWIPQKLNFSPDFGFAWSPSAFKNKLVVRGGYGLGFNQEEIAQSANAGNNPKTANFYNFDSNNATSINPKISYAVSSNIHSINGFPANSNATTTYNSSNLPINGSASVFAFGNFSGKLPTAYAHHFSLDTQYDLGHQWVASLGYQGSLGRHLSTQSEANAAAAVQGVTLNPLVTNVDYYSNGGGSSSNALLAELKHDFAHQFSVDTQFAWAKSMDDGSGPYEEDPYPYNPIYAWGRSDFNVGKSLKVFGIYQPVFFHGSKAWLEKAAGGWSLSGIVTLHTGYGWTPNFGTGQSLYCNGCGYGNLRPDYLGGAGHSTSNNAYKSGPGVGSGVNQNFPNQVNATPPVGGATFYSGSPYFAVPNYGQAISGPAFPGVAAGLPPPPGIARNSFTGPGYRDVDATLGKAFGLPNVPVLGENAKFEIRADFFNFFNNLNFNPTSISNNIPLSNFGQAQSALGARTISFQGRFSF